jgi:hypothetical protein
VNGVAAFSGCGIVHVVSMLLPRLHCFGSPHPDYGFLPLKTDITSPLHCIYLIYSPRTL